MKENTIIGQAPAFRESKMHAGMDLKAVEKIVAECLRHDKNILSFLMGTSAPPLPSYPLQRLGRGLRANPSYLYHSTMQSITGDFEESGAIGSDDDSFFDEDDEDSTSPPPRPPSAQAVAALRESYLVEGSNYSEGFLDRLEQLGGTPNVQDKLVFDPIYNVLLPPNSSPADRARAELEHHGRVRLLRYQQFIASAGHTCSTIKTACR